MSTQPPLNPFTQRGAIREPSQFFGRRAELHKIFESIGKLQSVSVVGERRIGKSSLLHAVYAQGPPRLPAAARCIHLDVQRVQDEGDFYARVLETLGLPGGTFRALEKAVADKPVLVCLDEFEQVAGNEAFSLGFFDGLRSLAQDGLALVTATQHSLYELCKDKKFAGSQFWNIFQRVDLGLFTSAEAKDLIQTGFAQVSISVTEREVSRLLRLSGRFPFFLQMACACLFQAKTGQPSQWEQAFQREARDHLIALWQCRTSQEHAALRRTLKSRARTPDAPVLEALEQRGLLVRVGQQSDDWKVFSEAFEDIVRHPPKQGRTWRWPTLKTVQEWIRTLKELKGLVPSGEDRKEK